MTLPNTVLVAPLAPTVANLPSTTFTAEEFDLLPQNFCYHGGQYHSQSQRQS